MSDLQQQYPRYPGKYNQKTQQAQAVKKQPKQKKFKRRYISFTDPAQQKQSKIIGGDYDEKLFHNYIVNLLTTRGQLKLKEAERYTDKAGMIEFMRATSHVTWNFPDPRDNYELYEHLGDTTVNKSTTWYLSRRFTDITNMGKDSIVIFTRQKNLVTSKDYLASYAEKIGLNKFIRWRPLLYVDSNEDNIQARTGKKAEYKTNQLDRSMREDTFEAFFGCLENIIDVKEGIIGVGAAVCYKILASIFDQEDISVDKNILFDAKTKINQIVNSRHMNGWSVRYYSDIGNKTVSAILETDKERITFGPLSTTSEEADSEITLVTGAIEQKLAEQMLIYLEENEGIIKFAK